MCISLTVTCQRAPRTGSVNLFKSASVRSGGNDGVLRGLSGDALVITYQDAIPASARTAALPLTFPGTVSIPVPSVVGNRPLMVTLTDADLDLNLFTPDVVPSAVVLTSDVAGAAPVALTVVETGPATGVFTGACIPRVVGAGEDPAATAAKETPISVRRVSCAVRDASLAVVRFECTYSGMLWICMRRCAEICEATKHARLA